VIKLGTQYLLALVSCSLLLVRISVTLSPIHSKLVTCAIDYLLNELKIA
jgi:hypothetical protein